MKKHSLSRNEITIIAVLIALLASAGYLAYKTLTLETEVQKIDAQKQTALHSEQTAQAQLEDAQQQLLDIKKDLTNAEDEYDELKDDYRKEKKRNKKFEDQINALMGTVGDLDKLAGIDEELLQKYSKVYFLNENYVPSKIKDIDKDMTLAGRDKQFFHGNALPFLEKMIERAQRSDVDLKVLSAYRSFDTQAQLKGAYTQTYGSGANAFSADQGYSEHQLGTTLDLTDTATGGPWLAFENTEAFAWLKKNAYKYGFVLSYPKANGFYVFEPWHWRFVGEDLADHMHDEKINFYDMEQREIDEYLIKIFD